MPLLIGVLFIDIYILFNVDFDRAELADLRIK